MMLDKGLYEDIYDQTTFSADPNEDGTYTLTFSPSGEGKNGIPTGKDFYGVLRAYVISIRQDGGRVPSGGAAVGYSKKSVKKTRPPAAEAKSFLLRLYRKRSYNQTL